MALPAPNPSLPDFGYKVSRWVAKLPFVTNAQMPSANTYKPTFAALIERLLSCGPHGCLLNYATLALVGEIRLRLKLNVPLPTMTPATSWSIFPPETSETLKRIVSAHRGPRHHLFDA
jgi:hypothetical protein